jgi:hypothetical protein
MTGAGNGCGAATSGEKLGRGPRAPDDSEGEVVIVDEGVKGLDG